MGGGLLYDHLLHKAGFPYCHVAWIEMRDIERLAIHLSVLGDALWVRVSASLI